MTIHLAHNELKDRERAVVVLLDLAHQLPDALVAELRKYRGQPDDGPAELVRQRNACYVLLDFTEAIPDALEAELYAYAQHLDLAIDPPML